MRRIAMLTIVVAIVAVSAPDVGAVVPTYSVYDIGTLPGDTSSQGNAVGIFGSEVDGQSGDAPFHAFFFRVDSGGLQPYPPLVAGKHGYATVNAGFIAGSCEVSGGAMHPCLLSPNGSTDVGSLGGTSGAVTGIDESNAYAVGWGTTASGAIHAFHTSYPWGPTQMFDDDYLVAPSGSRASYFSGFNRMMHASGYYEASDGSYHGFLYRFYSTSTDLGNFGGRFTLALAINDSDTVVGWSTYSSPGAHAFRYDGSLHDLGVLPGFTSASVASAINVNGDIVGSSSNASGVSHAFLWTASDGMVDLNDHIDPSSGVVLSYATAIAAQGEITGSALFPGQSSQHAYLLSICGDGSVNPGEDCDEGTANGTAGSCCTQYCRLRSSTAVCRPAAGPCDLAETCTGADGACPADVKKPSTTSCTNDGNPCTLDVCDGSSNACQHPAGNGGAVCRAAAGECDVDDLCDGTTVACPDQKRAAGTACTADTNPCTLDRCDGTSNLCQHPAGNSGAACADDGNPCTTDRCDGTSTTCQHPAGNGGASCPDDGNPCTADRCDGTTTICQHPAGNAGAGCPDDGRPCTFDRCDGTSTVCQHPPKSPGTSCQDGNPCTSGDTCDASGNCAGGPPTDCRDADVCTQDTCAPATGCTHTVISGCDATNSADAHCTPSAGCTISTPSVDLTIPPGALPSATDVNVVGLVPGAACPNYDSLQGNNGKTGLCVNLLPNGLMLGVPGTLKLKWVNTGNICDVSCGAGCTMAEGTMKVFLDGAQESDRCDLTKGCPTPAAPGDIPHPCLDSTLCTQAVCNPDNDSWTIQGLKHFSEYVLGTGSCSNIVHPATLRVQYVGKNSDRRVTFAGKLPGAAIPSLDPVHNGLEFQVTQPAPSVPAMTDLLPPGAYDAATKKGWKVSGLSWKWIDHSAPPSGVSRLSIKTKEFGPGQYLDAKVRLKGEFPPSSYVSQLGVEISFPDTGVCYGTVPGIPTCEIVGNDLECRD